MTTLDQNPSSETPPNFQAAGYAIIRRALITQNQADGTELDDEGAAKLLLDAWEEDRQVRQVAWEEAAAAEEREREDADAERLREEDEARKADEKKRKTKFPTLVPGLPPPKGSGFRPCQKAIAKLENLEFVEMWFFTFTGCQVTRDAALSEEDSTLSLTQENGNIQLRRSTSTASYKHLITPDENLTWKDLLQAKNVFLEYIAKGGWPVPYLQMFTDFYCKLKLRSELRQPHGHGEKILILYHARARREWFDAARLKNLFDISVIDEDWMVEAHKEMWDNVHTQEIRKVEEKVTSNPTLKERNHAHRIWPTHPHPTSHHPMPLSLHTMPHSPRRTMPHSPHRIMLHLPHRLITRHPPHLTASLPHYSTATPPHHP